VLLIDTIICVSQNSKKLKKNAQINHGEKEIPPTGYHFTRHESY